MSLFSLLGIATKGMSAAQVGMDISGQNISNSDVDGYSRKRMNLTADYTKNGTFGQMGFGVSVVNIQRMRDTLLDRQISMQNQEVGYYEQQSKALAAVQDILTEPSDSGIQSYVDKFFDSWQNLANNPADLSARTMVKTSGEIMSDIFHNLSTQITDLRQKQNDEIISATGEVNKLTKDIFNLNREIASVELTGQNANDSRDKRDKDVRELGKLIDIDFVEDSHGQLTVTSAGSIVVSPAYQQDIKVSTSTRLLPDGTTITIQGLQFADSRRDYLPKSGKLRGLIDARDITIPEYRTKLDELAKSIVSFVNKQHEQGYSANGYNGVDFFDPTTIGASDIKLSAAINSDVLNIAAASGGQILSFNEPAGITMTYGTAPTKLTQNYISHKSVIVMAGSTALTEGTDYSIDYRQGTIQMLHSGFNGTSLTISYQYTNNGSKGIGDNANAVAIANIREQATMNKDVLGNPTSTYGEFYGSFIGKLGLSVNEATSNLNSRNYLIEQYQTQQDTIAGVSIDDEMTNIIQYQHVYAASARIVTTTSEMLDTLLKM